jgi:hypothetical protein
MGAAAPLLRFFLEERLPLLQRLLLHLQLRFLVWRISTKIPPAGSTSSSTGGEVLALPSGSNRIISANKARIQPQR